MILTAICVPLETQQASAQLFKPGNLVVSAYGNSQANTLDGQPTAISLYQFSPSGGNPLSLSVLPTADSVGASNNVGIVGEYGSSSEGNIQLTASGQYLTIAGYSATPSLAGNYANSLPAGALAQSADTSVPRVVALIDGNGNTNTSTIFNDLYTTNNPRAVYSANGTSLYISGQGDKLPADQGLFLAPTGLNTTTSSSVPTGIYNAKDTRFVTAFAGNLYYSLDKSGSPTGIFAFSGLPTNGTQAPVQITSASNGLTGSKKINYSPEGFYFANATTLYVADTGVPKAGGTGSGGIQKWINNGTAWVLQYTLTNPNFVSPSTAATANSGETGFEAITGQVVGNSVQLFAVSYTAGDDNPNGLYTVMDNLAATTGAGESIIELETSLGNGGLNFKGVSFAPVPAIPTPIVGINAVNLDLGYVGQPGTTSYDSTTGGFTLQGAGAGIGVGSQGDGFQIAGITQSGDTTIAAQVVSQTGGESGLMFKEDGTIYSSSLSIVYQAGVGAVVKTSNAGGSATIVGKDPNAVLPLQLELVRRGDTFSAYEKVNGQWTQLGGDLTVPGEPSSLIIGLVQSSDLYETLATGVFNDVADYPAASN